VDPVGLGDGERPAAVEDDLHALLRRHAAQSLPRWSEMAWASPSRHSTSERGRQRSCRVAKLAIFARTPSLPVRSARENCARALSFFAKEPGLRRPASSARPRTIERRFSRCRRLALPPGCRGPISTKLKSPQPASTRPRYLLHGGELAPLPRSHVSTIPAAPRGRARSRALSRKSPIRPRLESRRGPDARHGLEIARNLAQPIRENASFAPEAQAASRLSTTRRAKNAGRR
jgi:hypothetical protein